MKTTSIFVVCWTIAMLDLNGPGCSPPSFAMACGISTHVEIGKNVNCIITINYFDHNNRYNH